MSKCDTRGDCRFSDTTRRPRSVTEEPTGVYRGTPLALVGCHSAAGIGRLFKRDALAFNVNKTLAAWGNNSFGELDGPSGERFKEVGAGLHYSVGITRDGRLVVGRQYLRAASSTRG
jgi:hypothetical protein